MIANCKFPWTERTEGNDSCGYVLADRWTTAAFDKNFIDMQMSSVTALNIRGDWRYLTENNNNKRIQLLCDLYKEKCNQSIEITKCMAELRGG